MRIQLPIMSCLLLTACGPSLVPVRLDGKSIRGNPVLAQQLNTDNTICQGEAQKANLSGVTLNGGVAGALARNDQVGVVMNGCMAQRGYAMVPEEQASQHEAAFAANAQSEQAITTGSIAPRR